MKSVPKISDSLLLAFIIFGCINAVWAQAPTVGLIQHDEGTLDDGYVLFAPITSNTTYLIDKCGKQVHSWRTTYKPGVSVFLLEDGNLLRTGNTSNSTFATLGAGGTIEKIDWNGNVLWSYTISDANECMHHDVYALPNGNILVIAWEKKTQADAIAAGRNADLSAAYIWSEQILELQPTGTNGAKIVWEWHLWDHLVQDFDDRKANFGVVAENPGLINVNYAALPFGKDWIHLNSIDYNAVLDQLVISSKEFSEIWVIDHSTSTAEAKGHSGGASGKGGDILYRYGNPAAYNSGSVEDQQFWGQHNAYWIKPGLPFENNIMVFNNGNGRTDGSYSSVEIIAPPINAQGIYDTVLPYGPAAPLWAYTNPVPENFYAPNISGSQQLANGNVLISDGPAGTFFEIDSNRNTVWKYISPVIQGDILPQGSEPSENPVFRATFYPSTYSGFSAQTLIPGKPIENENSVSHACNIVLPKQLISFNAVNEGKINRLSWSTASEFNSKGFNVEYSTDGRNFKTLQFVPAKAVAGNSAAVLHYEAKDNITTAAIVYYRLKLESLSGSYQYSAIVNVSRWLSTPQVLVYPNPVTNKLLELYIGDNTKKLAVTIFDLHGKIILSKSYLAGQYSNRLQLSADFRTGTYLIVIENGVQKINKKIEVVSK